MKFNKFSSLSLAATLLFLNACSATPTLTTEDILGTAEIITALTALAEETAATEAPEPTATEEEPPPTESPTATETPAEIGGIVWHDLCATPFESGSPAPPGCLTDGSGSYYANGILETGEPGIAGVEVWLGTGACPSTGAATAFTDGSGVYNFGRLAAGTYCVTIEVLPSNESTLIPGGWTYPPPVGGASKETTIAVGPGEVNSTTNFGWDFQFAP